MSEEDPTAVTKADNPARQKAPESGISPAPTVRFGPTPSGEPAVSAFDPPALRFEAQSELGRGGMGFVVNAVDHALGRQVAIKQMISTDAVDLRRFEREARITARLEHPSIVPVHDAGRNPDGTPYYVMRSVDGRPLDQLVDKHSLAERLALVPNVLASCDAVAYAHARGIIHRDIKPTNILVGPFGETLLIDWGLAREVGDAVEDHAIPSSDADHLTRVGTIAGTPGFMAPEQARGETVDERADVFALGATLFYVLAGRAPYAAHSATEMIHQVGTDRPPDWKLIPDGVPPDLRAIVVKAMASDPDARYANGGELATDLRRFTTGQLVGAYRYGRGARLARFARRNRAALVVAVISVAVLAVLLVIGVRRIVAERDDADAAREIAEQGKRAAVDAADKLLVQHALELAAADPSAAVSVLRSLPLTSTRWAEASIAAEAARVQGIPFGFAVASAPFFRLEISTNSKRALAATAQGTVSIVDLETHARHDLPRFATSPWGISWYDNDRVAYGVDDFVVLADATSGAIVRKIRMPAKVMNLFSNRAARLIVELKDSVYYTIAGEQTEPGPPVLRDVDLFVPNRTLDAAAIIRHHELLYWTPAGIVHVEANGHPQVATADGDQIAALEEDGVVRQWHIAKGVAEKTLDAMTPHMLSFTFSAGELYAYDGVGLVRYADNRALAIGTNILGIFADGRRVMVTATDGSIQLHDDEGWLTLGKRAATYSRVTWSDDGRFVVATTRVGTILVWDLPTIRPRTIGLEGAEGAAALTDRSLWTRTLGEAVYRRDLATGKREHVFDSQTLLLKVTDDEHWAIGFDSLVRHAIIYSATTRRVTQLQEIEILAVGADSVYICGRDGRIVRFADDASAGEELVTLANLPVLVDAAGPYMMVVDAKGRVIRFRSGRNPVEIQLAGDISSSAVNPDTGEIWLVHDGGLLRWDGVASPVTVAVPGPVGSVAWTRYGMISGSLGALYRADLSPPRLLANNLYQFNVGGDVIPTVNPQRFVSVHDLPTGLTFDLPVHSAGIPDLLVHGRHIGYSTEDSATSHTNYVLWDLEVPSGPAAMQAWLATITNARSIPDSEAVVWPEH